MLLMLIGLPGAGKTKLASELLNRFPRLRRVSRDDVRRMLRSRYIFDKSDNIVVDMICKGAIKVLLKSSWDVIYDATNLTADIRVAFINNLRNDFGQFPIVALVFSIENAEKYRLRTEHSMSERSFQNMVKIFIPPALAEGFTKVLPVRGDSSDLNDLEEGIKSVIIPITEGE